MSTDEAVTSSAQNGLWFLTELAPGASADTLHVAYRVRGDLDAAALRAGWRSVLARHESLRTTIVAREGVPRRRVAAEASVEACASGPVDLADGPTARLSVTTTGEGEHRVDLVVHRAVCDEESLAVIVGELAAAYAGRPLGTPPPGYPRHARNQHEQDREELVRWWRERLTPLPPPLDLPVDRTRPRTPAAEVGQLRFSWPELAGPLARLSTQVGVAPGTVLLAAFQTLLHRYSGEELVAVGVPAVLRPREFAGTVGQFRNLLVVCASFDGRPAFAELVSRVATATDEALAHGELPFEELVGALPVDRDPRRVPFCDAMFVLNDGSEPSLALPGVEVTAVDVTPGPARADLTLTVDRVDEVITGALTYRDSLFEPSSATQVLAQLHTLLTAALTDPALPAVALPLEGEQALLAAARAADLIDAGPPGQDAVNVLVHRAAARTPDAPALSWAGQRVTYRDLVARAARIASALGPDVAGEPVLVRMATGPDQVAAVLAVLDAGARLVCLGGGDTGDRGRSVLAELRPACLVLDGAAGEDTLATWYAEEHGGRLLDVADLPAGDPVRPATPGPEAGAYVAYTSGSTGRPKGIPQTHGTLAQFVTWFAGEFGIGPGARVAQWAAPGYDASLGELFSGLLAGATVCPVPDRIRANPEKIVDWLEDERITVFQTVPSFVREILQVVRGRGRPEQLRAVNHLLLAGEPLPGDLAGGLRSTLPGVRLVNLYGPTELILASWHEIGGPVHGTAPIGRSIPGRQVLVLDDEGRPCPAGVTGNLVIRGPHVTSGYLGAAAGERDQFRELAGTGVFGLDGPCYRTGDQGRRRWDGALEFRGRGDFQVKFNGVRLELADIETALAEHESVAECALVAVTDSDRLVRRLVAYVVPRRTEDGKTTGAANAWRVALRRRFGKAMPPVLFRTMIAMPRNVGGKIDRRLLPDPGPVRPAAVRAPESAVEQGVARIWAGLGVDVSTVEDQFFAAGGHSLLVPRVLDALRERYGTRVQALEFFANPTVAGLAALVESQSSFLVGNDL